MKIATTVISILLLLLGGVWFLQGTNVLPGSFMSGQALWAIIGGIAFVIGIILLFFTYRRGPAK